MVEDLRKAAYTLNQPLQQMNCLGLDSTGWFFCGTLVDPHMKDLVC